MKHIKNLSLTAIPIYYYGCVWLFNHISAWLGIGVAIVGTYFLFNHLFNKKK